MSTRTVTAAYVPTATGRAQSHLQVADRAFAALACPPAPLALDVTALPPAGDRPVWLAGAVPLLELRERMLDRCCPYPVRDVVWRELVRRARAEGGVWLIATVGMAMPRLIHDAGRLTRGYTGDPADVDNAMLEGFLTAVTRTLDPDADGLPAKACWAAYRAGDRVRQAGEPVLSLHDLDPERTVAPHRPYGHPDLLLARAVVVGVLDRDEADLISRTRLDDEPVSVVARAAGVEPAVLRMRRNRAERRLVRALHAGSLSVAGADAASAVGAPARAGRARRR